jgi:hypothetical protein
VRPRDATGEFLITEEDVAYYAKVQERVTRKQSIDGQVRGIMMRLDRFAERGEIQPLAPERRQDVERVLRRYVEAGHDLNVRFARPSEEARELTNEQRREEITSQRTQLVAAAQADLEPILGAADAAKVAEESLQRTWGLRGPGRRFEERR